MKLETTTSSYSALMNSNSSINSGGGGLEQQNAIGTNQQQYMSPTGPANMMQSANGGFKCYETTPTSLDYYQFGETQKAQNDRVS